MKKHCKACGQFKPYSEFSFNGRSKDGMYDRCKPCWKAYLKDRRRPLAQDWKEKFRIKLRAALEQRDWEWVDLCAGLPKNNQQYRAELARALKDVGAVRMEDDFGIILWGLHRD